MKKLTKIISLFLILFQITGAPALALAQTKANLTKYTNELTQLQSEYAKVSYATPALSSSEITRLNTLITTNQTLVATLTNEIKAQQSEIANEASFEKSMSDQTETVGTQEYRTYLANTVPDAINYIKNNPGKVAQVAGVTLILVSGAIVCVATAPVCASVLGYAAVGVTSVATLNGVSVITTQTTLLGNPVSDKEWAQTVFMFPLDIAGSVIGVSELKIALRAKLGAEVTESLISLALRDAGQEGVKAKQVIQDAIAGIKAEQALLSTLRYADRTITTTNNVWDLKSFVHGQIIDTNIVGNNLGGTFPQIDNLFTLDGGLIESMKSMDIINSSTYQTRRGMVSKVKGYVNDIAGKPTFGGTGGYPLLKKGIHFKKIGLSLVIPEGAISAEQAAALTEIRAYAKSMNVEFVLTVLKLVK